MRSFDGRGLRTVAGPLEKCLRRSATTMTTASPARSDRPVYTDIGKALGTDYFLLRAGMTEDEKDYLQRARRFVEEEVLPQINPYWERAEVPLDLCRRLGEL